MSWDPNQPNQGQNPEQGSQYGAGYGQQPPSQPTDPYSQQNPYSQQGPYGPTDYNQSGYQQPGQASYGQQQYGGYQQPYGTPPMGGASALGPSTMSMDPKTAAGLSYLGIWVTGLIFFLLEKQNRFVRFHAMQSILFFGGLVVLSIVLGIAIDFSPGLLSLGLVCLNSLVGLVGFVAWIVLMINAFQGKYFKLPVVGDYAEKFANQNTLSL